MSHRVEGTSSGRPERWAEVDVTNSMSGTRLGAAVAVLALALPGAVSAGSLPADAGTRAMGRADVRMLAQGTRLYDLDFEGAVDPIVRPTMMGRIRELAPLSLREWAYVFDTSHTSIHQWIRREPQGRSRVGVVLEALERAARYHGDLASWLRTPLSGTGPRPLDLLREGKWRAFDGALRLGPHELPRVAPEELSRLRREELSWALPELPDGEASD